MVFFVALHQSRSVTRCGVLSFRQQILRGLFQRAHEIGGGVEILHVMFRTLNFHLAAVLHHVLDMTMVDFIGLIQ